MRANLPTILTSKIILLVIVVPEASLLGEVWIFSERKCTIFHHKTLLLSVTSLLFQSKSFCREEKHYLTILMSVWNQILSYHGKMCFFLQLQLQLFLLPSSRNCITFVIKESIKNSCLSEVATRNKFSKFRMFQNLSIINKDFDGYLPAAIKIWPPFRWQNFIWTTRKTFHCG